MGGRLRRIASASSACRETLQPLRLRSMEHGAPNRMLRMKRLHPNRCRTATAIGIVAAIFSAVVIISRRRLPIRLWRPIVCRRHQRVPSHQAQLSRTILATRCRPRTLRRQRLVRRCRRDGAHAKFRSTAAVEPSRLATNER